MSVVRSEKSGDFTRISNDIFREKSMSLKAKGLLSLMLSLPDDWDYSIKGLTGLSTDGKDSVMKALSELEHFGYLKRRRVTDEKGHFAGYEYDVLEKPQNDTPCSENPNTGNPNTGKPNTEKPYSENPPQLTTKYINDEKINISSVPSDEIDGQLSLTEDNLETGDKSPSGNTVTMSVKEAAEFIYKAYPRKEGKAKGFEQVKQLLKGKTVSDIGRVKFNHCQLYCAVREYDMVCEESGRETNFIQLFSTFMNKTVLDYVEKSAEGYEKYMQREYGEEWRSIKFVYR